ncbi:MAG: hypothetical protein LBQ52_00740 [Helicobacteraceae bacterium]|jgi:hypothetical protein|nr:hypothetical protein [Helicobacteraceae bacterium]
MEKIPIPINFPEELKEHKEEILKDFKEAFEVSLGGRWCYTTLIKAKKAFIEYEGEVI